MIPLLIIRQNCRRSFNHSCTPSHRKVRLCTVPTTIPNSRIVYLKNEITGADIYLVGTNHVSGECAEEVRKVINNIKPDTIMIELDADRASRIRSANANTDFASEEFARSIIPYDTISPKFSFSKFSPVHILETLLKAFYNFFRQQGIIPGKEFLVAMTEAEKLGSQIVLGDRNSKVTLRRLWDSFSLQTIISAFTKISTGSDEQTEILKRARDAYDPNDPKWFSKLAESVSTRRDARLYTRQLEKVCPNMVKVLLHERDIYMINSLRNCKSKNKIVAVVGLGHLDGMEKYWNNLNTRAKELHITEEDLKQP